MEYIMLLNQEMKNIPNCAFFIMDFSRCSLLQQQLVHPGSFKRNETQLQVQIVNKSVCIL